MVHVEFTRPFAKELKKESMIAVGYMRMLLVDRRLRKLLLQLAEIVKRNLRAKVMRQVVIDASRYQKTLIEPGVNHLASSKNGRNVLRSLVFVFRIVLC